MALDCELVWATSWMDDANDCIAPRLGLSPLAMVTWPDAAATEVQDEREGLHWKTRTLVARAAGRPFVWLDDEITDNDRFWVSAHHPGPALLHRVNPNSGTAPLRRHSRGRSRNPRLGRLVNSADGQREAP